MRGPDSADRRILALAVPAAGSALVTVLLYRATDLYWVGTLGKAATAGLSVSTNTVWFFGAFSALVSIGLGAVVARYVGAARLEAASYSASQGLRWAAVLGLASAAVGWVGAPWVFDAAHAEPDVAAAGVPYTRVFWTGGIVLLVQNAGDAVFRAHGNTRLPFLFSAVGVGVNFLLDPLLIFGWGPVPALGVEGAAWATVASALLAASLAVVALRRRGWIGTRRPEDDVLRLDETTRLGRPGLFGLDPAMFVRVARVGLPVTGAGLVFNSIYLVLQRIASDAEGPAAQAALGVGWMGEGMAFVLCLGWSAAASSLVGRSLGARRPEEAERLAWRAVVQCAVLCGVWGGILFLFDRPIASLFTDDPQVLDLASAYYRIVALCLAPQAVEIVLEGAFGGAGLTVPPLVITGVFTGLRIPLALWAAEGLGMGAIGIWWAIMLTATLRGVACAVWFARGTWKTRSV